MHCRCCRWTALRRPISASRCGWQTLDPAQFPGATQVTVEPNLVENGFAPNAVLLVGKLSHSIDPEALMALGFGDGRAMPGWVEREASTAGD